MNRSRKHLSLGFVILSMTFLLGLSISPSVRADIVFTGTVVPANPLDWNSSTDGYVGYSGYDGTALINGGDTLYSKIGRLGCNRDTSTGEMTIDGVGSTWINSEDIYIGYSGYGILNIKNGGVALVHGKTRIVLDLPKGQVRFGPGGGTLTTSSLQGWTSQLTGTGTINTRGIVSDLDIVFDNDHSLNQTITLNESGQNITLNLDMSDSENVGELGVSNSTLTIQDNITVTSSYGHIGTFLNSTGTATVSGNDSAWQVNNYLRVGYSGFDGLGTGNLHISDGATVSVNGYTSVCNSSSYIHFNTGGTLTTQTLATTTSQLTGIGTINTHGLSSNLDLVFDQYHGSSQSFTLNGQEGQNITVNLDMSNPDDVGNLTISNHSLIIQDGIAVASASGRVDGESSTTATVSGPGSSWTITNGNFSVGWNYQGTLDITNGGKVVCSGYDSYIGVNDLTPEADVLTTASGDADSWNQRSIGEVTVDGTNSTWTNNTKLYVGLYGQATLTITNGGLVSVAETLVIDQDTDGDGRIDMATGGMLALMGEADNSLTAFYDLIGGTDNIRYCNSNGSWSSLTNATLDTDYTLEYLTEGELAGYTLLTVGTPSIPGDANCDGQVDGSDATILANYWQVGVGDPDPETITWAMGDFNHDGQVDGSDATLLAAHWQEGVPAPNAVPEPAGGVLLAMLLLAAGVLRWQKFSRRN